jgi:hypothetical protein
MQNNQASQYNTPRGYRGGYIGGGQGRGGFGRGIGPIVCHNCHEPGHYARECPLQPATCMHYCTTNHNTKDCPTLLGNIQEKRNQNNQNVQWIYVKAIYDGRNINIVTRGGAKIGTDLVRHDPTPH